MATVIINTKDFTGAIEGVIARASNPAPVLTAFGLYMVGSIKRNFQEQGRPNPWAPLKVNTLLARYTRSSEGRKIPKAADAKRFDPNPNVFKKQGRLSGSYDDRLKRYLGDASSASTVPGMARSPKTGRVLRGKHGGLNKFAPAGMVFRRPALRAILSGQILIDSGDLRSSITSEMQGKSKVAIGTAKEYANYQHYGYPQKNNPARPFVILQPDDEVEFGALLTEWISGGGKFGG